ncbi:helix-hairpin-helix domain-containing protein [Antrihabitans sp. YC2-6]|uniref:ComEA family DNA-binding protein n=1 Tax=Antrihabitans sp. YC2-6 TaxID=2799498 RepID=UPI0018F288EB|nr:helix-hairpin-helix domain-containing protein [Antrihabitans sp. YC2-6]MBJ8346826.1 helix-hairpin-helix domain-containing protein [Antrihabitans sp. YC2-6]
MRSPSLVGRSAGGDDHDLVRNRLESVLGDDSRGREPGADYESPRADTPDWLAEPDTGPSRWTIDRLRGARLNPGRRGAIALAGVAIVVAAVAGAVVFGDRPMHRPAPAVQSVSVPTSSAAAEPAELVVSVVGLVNVSGLVRLPPGARVADAIAAAGGAKDGADLFSLNMAQRVSDGDQILVGVAGAGDGPPVLGSATVTSSGETAGATAVAGKINLNTATEAELDSLPGVGPVTAAAIVAWRTANGRFTDIEQLAEVDGIGPTRLARLRDQVTL